MSLDEFDGLTSEELHYRIEAFRERTYWQTRPLMSLLLQNVDEKGITSILSNTPGDSKRAVVMDRLMAPYTPLWRREQAQGGRAQPVPGMSPRAAEGLIQAAEQGLIPDADWLKLVRVWERVVATAG